MLEMSYFTSIGLHIQLFILDFTFCLGKLTTVNHLLLSQVLNYDHISESRKKFENFSKIRSLGIRDTYKVCTYKRMVINIGLLICP